MLWVVWSGVDDRRYEYGRARNVVAVGWSLTGPIEPRHQPAEVLELVVRAYPETNANACREWATQLWEFAHDFQPGDYVLVPLVDGATVAVAEVTGPYAFDADAPANCAHVVPVTWLRTVTRDKFDADIVAQLDNGAVVHRVPAVQPVDSGTAVAAPIAVAPSAPAAESEPDRHLSRRAFLFGGVAAATAGVGVVAWRTWKTSERTGFKPLASRHPAPSTTGSTAGTTTTTKPSVTASANGPVAAWVVAENAKPGTTAWRITDPGKTNQIEGYTGAVSAIAGETVGLHVSTTDPSFHAEAYRLGYYQGAGGRLVWQSDGQAGVRQARPTVTPTTLMAEANWEPSLSIPIDASFPPGVYLIKIVGASGAAHYAPLTVRDDASTAAYMVQNSVTTWQAYNDWGGHSLYKGPLGDFARRARIVSFDRPYNLGAGQSDFLGLEFPLIMLMEQLGLDVTYTTDVDTHAAPQRIAQHQAFLSLGHDEYWSKSMRDGVEGARDGGVNVGFLGANAAFRQIRFAGSNLGPNRREICYKSASEDPMRHIDHSLTTVNWRDAPVSRPESSMIGQQYESNPVRADMVIADPEAWVFQGTNVTAGQKLSGTIGSEYDRYRPGQVGPPNVQILAHSPLVCHGVRSYSDMTYYAATSGAGVLSTGTIDWITKLTPPGPGSPYDPIVEQITKNVLAGFGSGKVGATRPSEANYETVAARFGSSKRAVSSSD
jgi:hypothetical protein